VSVPALVAAFCLASVSTALAAPAKSAKLSLSPTLHSYGTVVVGQNSASQSFAVTNTGQGTSGPVSVTVTGTNAADFVVDANSCTGTLAAGDACSVSVHFAPAASGSRKATLSISATPGGTVTAALQGTGTQAQLVMSPTSFQYGTITVGATSASQTFTVTNTGGGASGPVSVAITGANAGDFTQASSTCGAAIPAGSSCAVKVVFAPSATGTRSATLTATASPGGSASAKLTGSGAARALLAITPSTFDFGPVVVGSSSDAKTFTVTNTGQGTSGTLTVGLGGTDAANFVIDSTTCGAKLAIGASCTVSVHFTPPAAKADTATLSAVASPGGTATAALQGTGATPANLSIAPATFDFGNVVAGSSSGDQSFTVTNTGQGTSGPVSVSLSGANQADFSVDSTTCGAALPGGGTCTVSVQYAPAAAGAGTATLSATASPGGTATSALQGTGITPAALSIAPATFDFGPTAAGADSSQQSFTVTNTGQGTSGPVTVALNGSDAADFVIDSNTCGDALPGGGTCTVAVHFTAGSVGTLTASLTATATPGGAAAAALQGEGLAPASLSINPTFFNFGQVPEGTFSAGESFVVTNTGQSPSGTVSVSLGGPDSFEFIIRSTTCTSGLAAGASCTVTVAFEPFFTGFAEADVSAVASPGGNAAAIMQGDGIIPAHFNISSPSDFGNVVVGTSTTDQTITVTNNGGQTSGVVSAVLGGADPADFTVDTDTCTAALAPGQSCAVTVHFTPAALGGRSATITVSASPGGSQAVNLHGTGVNILMVAPAAFTFPNQPVGTTSATAEDFVLTNFGTSPLSSFTVTASDSTHFPITADTCTGATLNHNDSCKVSVTFNGADLGQFSSDMTASFVDGNQVTQSVNFQASGTAVTTQPDLATSMTVTSQTFDTGTVQITVANLDSSPSVATTMTINVDPTQDFSYSAGAGTDCTARSVNSFDSQFTCPVPVIPGARSITRTLTINNLSGNGPHLVQTDATTIMPGDTNPNNNTGFANVNLGCVVNC
jgi:hypothetical protein